MIQLKGKRNTKSSHRPSRLPQLALPRPDAKESTEKTDELPAVAQSTNLIDNNFDATLTNAVRAAPPLFPEPADPLVDFRNEVEKKFIETRLQMQDMYVKLATNIAPTQDTTGKTSFIVSPADNHTVMPLVESKPEMPSAPVQPVLSA